LVKSRGEKREHMGRLQQKQSSWESIGMRANSSQRTRQSELSEGGMDNLSWATLVVIGAKALHMAAV
jgi:hypothetical protein